RGPTTRPRRLTACALTTDTSGNVSAPASASTSRAPRTAPTAGPTWAAADTCSKAHVLFSDVAGSDRAGARRLQEGRRPPGARLDSADLERGPRDRVVPRARQAWSHEGRHPRRSRDLRNGLRGPHPDARNHNAGPRLACDVELRGRRA